MTEAAPIRISQDMVKPYDGEGDLISWIKKAQLVAKLAGIKDLASFLPLYLEGDALAVYLEMDEEDQKDAKQIEAKLKEAFTDGQFIAYDKLTKYKWDGEPVDVYCTEIRRLVGLSGMKGDGAKRLVKLAFVNGMPERIRAELMQIEDIEDIEMSEVLPKARVLVGVRSETSVGAVAVSRQSGGSKSKYGGRKGDSRGGMGGNSDSRGVTGGNSDSRSGARGNNGFKGKCFKCEGPHMAKDCPDKRITCYKCGEEGHMSYNCESEN